MADSFPRSWLNVDESAAEMFARMETERPALFIPPLHRVPIRAGNVVEITGPSPTAKSEILLQAAVNCILPEEWNGVPFGGLERAVAYIDLDCRFDVLRLSEVLKLRIMCAYGSAHGTHGDLYENFPRKSFIYPQVDILDDELLLSCMKRFFYIRCYNSSEFLATLKTIHPGYTSSSEGLLVSLHILIIDSIGAFHWNDRACQPLTKEDQARKKISLEKLTESIVQEINKIREVQPLLVLASKATLFGAAIPTNDVQSKDFHKQHSEGLRNVIKKDGEKLLYREYMSPVWQSLVTHKVHLGISDVDSSDETNGTQTYMCKWIQPPVNILDKFVVKNNGISMVHKFRIDENYCCQPLQIFTRSP